MFDSSNGSSNIRKLNVTITDQWNRKKESVRTMKKQKKITDYLFITHSLINMDVKRWNSEEMFLYPIPDHEVCVIMPPETSTEEALRDFCMTNDFDIQEHIIHVTNMHSCFLPDFLLLPVYT